MIFVHFIHAWIPTHNLNKHTESVYFHNIIFIPKVISYNFCYFVTKLKLNRVSNFVPKLAKVKTKNSVELYQHCSLPHTKPSNHQRPSSLGWEKTVFSLKFSRRWLFVNFWGSNDQNYCNWGSCYVDSHVLFLKKRIGTEVLKILQQIFTWKLLVMCVNVKTNETLYIRIYLLQWSKNN